MSKFTTPNKLAQSYIECELDQKIDILWSFIKSHLRQKSLVFISSQKQVRFIYYKAFILYNIFSFYFSVVSFLKRLED